MNKVDKFVATAFKALIVVYVLAVVFRTGFRPNIYRMVSVPLEYCLGIMLVYIGGRWTQTKLGVSQNGPGNLNVRALLKILGTLTALILVCIGIEYVFHSFSLTQQAVQDLQGSAEVQGVLGAPIRVGWFITGSMQIKGDAGAASLSIPVRGITAEADLEVKGVKKDGSWYVTDLYLITDSNKAVVQIPH